MTFLIRFFLLLMLGQCALAQSSLPLTAGKVLIGRIDIDSRKKIPLPEGRWVVMGLHSNEIPLTGGSKTSQTVNNVSLMNDDENAPFQYLSVRWTAFSDTNWTDQPCDSNDSVKSRPKKDTFSTNTSSVTVKCSAASYNTKFGNLNFPHNYTKEGSAAKNLWLPVAQHSRSKPITAAEVYGFISKNRNDFINWHGYINPHFFGLDQLSDTQYSTPTNSRQIIADKLLEYTMNWNKQYMEQVEKEFFPNLFQSTSRSVDRFNFQESVKNIQQPTVASSPQPSNVERDRLAAEVEAERKKSQEIEQQLAAAKERDQITAELDLERKKRQELEAQLASSAQPSPPQTNAPRRTAHALVIGNGAYPGSGRLDNPVNDANAISQKLRSMGFTVTTVTDANRQRLVQSMAQFRRTAASADISLLYYAGHGVQIFGTNYILPTDVDQTDPAQATIQGVSLNSVVENFLPGKTKLVFLDACRDNALQRTNDRSVSKGLAPISAAEGTLISYATKDGQTAADGVGSKNSPFTQALLEHLNDPQDIAVVLRKVRERVMKITGGKQQPWEYGSLTGGELVLSAIKPK